MGQAVDLQRIFRTFPELQAQVTRAEAEFKVTIGKSCENIESILRKILGTRLDEIHEQGINKLNEIHKNNKLSVADSVLFINKVRERAKGEIESPYRETLLSFHPEFEANPALEFSRGYTKKYRTAEHPKAKGLDVEISIPASWKAREGNRPNIVQFFRGQNGYGDATLGLQIREFTPPAGMKITQKHIDALFSPAGLKELVGAAADVVVIESKPIVWEGQKGAMLVYDTVAERLDVRLKVRTLSYITLYENRMVFLQFAIGNTEDKMNETIKEFNKNRPLFQLVANSFILMDKYK
ncbi:MAG: hypothetical protein M3384_12785 [Acidobacteriota bacterium]|nr:hypothetical protein [Acidobacteriota bacterium]